nr:hypothetical protein [Desulfosarcina cetonica]
MPAVFFFQLPQVGGREGIDAHENTRGRAQVQVGPLAIHQTPAEPHTARRDGHCLRIHAQVDQFPAAQSLESGRRDRKIIPYPAGHMPTKPFIDTFGLGSPVFVFCWHKLGHRMATMTDSGPDWS